MGDRPLATPEAPLYVPLWVKSNYSFLEGGSHPEELVEQAAAHGLERLCLTDRDGLYGIVRGEMKARELGLTLRVGAQLSVALPGVDAAQPLLLLAMSREGYGHLCRLLTLGHLDQPKGESLVTPRMIEGEHEGLLALCPTPELLHALREPFEGRIYALLARHLEAEEVQREVRLRTAAALLSVPTVAAVEVLYHAPERRPIADLLTCIRHGVTLSAAGRRLRSNAEHALPSPAEMERRFADDLGSLRRTLEVGERAAFGMRELRYRYPTEDIPEGRSERAWLRELTFLGAARRYPGGLPEGVKEQIERELRLIEDLDYGGYFLTMCDIVRFCEQSNILCQGRGSAANSVVCYCLGITAIDPIRMDLLFERFLSRERAEPPDIDLDIEHERREEVIQYVYKKWGRRRAAMVANVIRYRMRSALREVGKVLGLPQTALDRASKLLFHRSAIDEELLERAGLSGQLRAVQQTVALASAICDFPRHLSIHPGGFLLGQEPVDTLVPVEPATMEGRTVIQWDKQDVEDLGLFKVDLLGLGALTLVHRAFELLRFHKGQAWTIAEVPQGDEATYRMISRGDTVGVFQIESRAQMSMLPRLRPRSFYDLVVEVAIVRPGPIQGDMVHPYLRRRDGLETVTYPHPKLEQVLAKTFGVPIFQEQVMKLAIEVADYSPGEADQLRRDMGAWRSRGRIEGHKQRLISRMVEKGIPRTFAERVYSQICGFGEYGFPESHAASFALLAYVTAWLRCHHPEVFLCALLNSWPMGFYHPSTLVEDAKRHGVVVRPIDAQRSLWDCTLEPLTEEERGRSIEGRQAVRMGLRYVANLGEKEKEKMARVPPPYASIEELRSAVGLGRRALLSMAEAGAFDSFGLDRRQALWAVRGILAERQGELPTAPTTQITHRFDPLSEAERITWDYNRSAHSTRGHPVEELRPLLEARGVPSARELNRLPDRARTRYVGSVICRQRPGTASGVVFMTLEDETGFVNLVIWKRVFDRFEGLVKSAYLLEIEGTIQSEAGVVNLVAEELHEPSLQLAAERPSRDFH